MVFTPQTIQAVTGGNKQGQSYSNWSSTPVVQSSTSARASELASMSEREFADYEMREAHKLGVEADSSKYQRAYSDIVKAGLNPRLLLQSGADTNMPTASSGYSYSQSKNESKSQSSSNSLSWSALAVGLAALAVKLIL